MSNSQALRQQTRMYNKGVSPEEARVYIEKRFRSKKMQRLDEAEKAFAEDLVARVGKAGSIVDVPCGSGRFSPILSQVQSVKSYDICENMLTEAKASEAYDNVTYDKANVVELPLENNEVDAAFCMRLFHHVRDSETRLKMLRELTRVSKQWVALTFYRRSWHYYWKKLRGKDPAGFPTDESLFLKEAEQCGLKVVYIKKFPFLKTNQTLVLFEKI